MSKRPPPRRPPAPRRVAEASASRDGPPSRPAGQPPRSARTRPPGPPKAEGHRRDRPVREADATRAPGLDAEGPAADARGPLWLYGRHAVRAAIANPERRIERLVAVATAAPELAAVASPLPRPSVEVVARAQLERLIAGATDEAVHQGMAALVLPLAESTLPELLDTLAPGRPALIAVLDQVSDPRNVGAILRSAAAFGVLGVVVQERHAPPVTAALAKAASGALERVPLVRVVNIARALDALRNEDFFCLGLESGAAATLAESLADGARRLALVLGAEDKGLRRLVREHCDALARIPIRTPHPLAPATPGDGGVPGLDSLNVSVAAALAFYEARRS